MKIGNRYACAMGSIFAVLLVTSCAQTPAEEAKFISQPEAQPVRNLTNFSESLRCMDSLFAAYGVRGITITSQGIPDATGEITTGTKEMLISAVSRMSVKSSAFAFVDFDQTQYDINALQDLVGFSEEFVVPNYYIRGAITQFDRNVIEESVGFGVSLGLVEAGISEDQILSLISMDLNIGELRSRQILPWASSNNSIAVRRLGQSANIGGTIPKADLGLSFNVSLTQSEGMHQAVRNLVELSAVEILGKLAQVPYWRCLQIEQTNKAVVAEARDWFDGMSDEERTIFIQRALTSTGHYSGASHGTLDDPTKEAVGVYQSENGLIADGRINFDLYASLISGDLALGQIPETDSTPQPLQPVATSQPLTVSLTSNAGTTPVFAVGDALVLSLSSSHDAYAYCYYQDANGIVARIFPNRFQPDARLAANTPVSIPGQDASFEIVFDKPGIREEVACLASEIEIGLALPDPLKQEDLTPLPFDSLDKVVAVFASTGTAPGAVVQARLPIAVAN
jgi:curli biogenesis system outer membrane secretion channel CsgG